MDVLWEHGLTHGHTSTTLRARMAWLNCELLDVKTLRVQLLNHELLNAQLLNRELLNT